MQLREKKLGAFPIAMMNVAIVASLQMMTACALYGYSLLFFYFLATLFFFLPCLLLVAQLAVAHPITGGAYVWVEKAYGKSWGFFAVAIQWLCNLIWYPTIFSLIANLLAQIFLPELAESKLYILGSAVFFFWGITILNAFGIQVSSLFTTVSSILGVIFPVLILIVCGIVYLSSGLPPQIHFAWSEVFKIQDSSTLAFLTQIVISLIGLEMVAVHAGDVVEPRKTIPKALFSSAFFILLIVVAAPLAIALVLPKKEIGIISGIPEALKAFFESLPILSKAFPFVIALIFLGNLGTVTGWMISSTRGMHVASVACHMPKIFRLTNRYHAPLGVLLLEAIVFTLVCIPFVLLSLENAYWILLELASVVALIYYLLVFRSAVLLRKKEGVESFEIWGGLSGTKICWVSASLAVLLAIFFSFFPPEGGGVMESKHYILWLAIGIVVSLAFPTLLLRFRGR